MLPSPPDDLAGRVAVVTGATRGIGRAVARSLAVAGAAVVVVGRTQRGRGNQTSLPGSVEETVEEIASLGVPALGVVADLCDEAQTEAVIERTRAEFGRCDVLVNNAAYTSNGPMLSIPWSRWQRAFRVQVVAPHQLCHGFLPGMLERGLGWVINVSSGASQSVSPGLGLYSTSKLAMERWSDFLELEAGGRGVSFNTLRVDRLVASEGWQLIAATDGIELATGGRPDAVAITAESTAAVVVWMARQPVAWSGNTVGFDDVVALGGPAIEQFTPERMEEIMEQLR